MPRCHIIYLPVFNHFVNLMKAKKLLISNQLAILGACCINFCWLYLHHIHSYFFCAHAMQWIKCSQWLQISFNHHNSSLFCQLSNSCLFRCFICIDSTTLKFPAVVFNWIAILFMKQNFFVCSYSLLAGPTLMLLVVFNISLVGIPARMV